MKFSNNYQIAYNEFIDLEYEMNELYRPKKILKNLMKKEEQMK
jgi:hypothetical protein